MDAPIKRCTKCGGDFPATAEYFHQNGGMLYPSCKQCKNAQCALLRKNAPESICKHCGQKFHAYRKSANFCSTQCRIDHKSAQMVEKDCPQCGKHFKVKASIARRYATCSEECRIAYRAVWMTCERCGKRFRGTYTKHHKFCSDDCRYPPRYINCRTCGKSFRVGPNKQSTRQFCSFACYRRSQVETSLERSVRLALDTLEIAYVQEGKVGRYSVDFLIEALNTALEADGNYWHRNPARDQRKNDYLNQKGWKVCRVSETEVNTSHNLAELIRGKLSLPHSPSATI